MSQMPLSLMQFLSGIAQHSQVLIAVPNPAAHWADAIDGRELLRQQRRRHADKGWGSHDSAGGHARPCHRCWRQLAEPRLCAPARCLRHHGRYRRAMGLAARRCMTRPMRALIDAPAGPGAAAHPRSGALVEHSRSRDRRGRPVHRLPQGPWSGARVEVLHDQLLQWLAEPACGKPPHWRRAMWWSCCRRSKRPRPPSAPFGQWPPRCAPYSI